MRSTRGTERKVNAIVQEILDEDEEEPCPGGCDQLDDTAAEASPSQEVTRRSFKVLLVFQCSLTSSQAHNSTRDVTKGEFRNLSCNKRGYHPHLNVPFNVRSYRILLYLMLFICYIILLLIFIYFILSFIYFNFTCY